MNPNSASAGISTSGGMVALALTALALVFLLHYLGFRFVVTAGLGR